MVTRAQHEAHSDQMLNFSNLALACATSDALQAKRARHENVTKFNEMSQKAIALSCLTATIQGRVAWATSDGLQAIRAHHENVTKLDIRMFAS